MYSPGYGCPPDYALLLNQIKAMQTEMENRFTLFGNKLVEVKTALNQLQAKFDEYVKTHP